MFDRSGTSFDPRMSNGSGVMTRELRYIRPSLPVLQNLVWVPIAPPVTPLTEIPRLTTGSELKLRLMEALSDYQQGFASLGRAAEIAGLPYDQMISELERHAIPVRFGPTDQAEAEQEDREFVERVRRRPSPR